MATDQVLSRGDHDLRDAASRRADHWPRTRTRVQCQEWEEPLPMSSPILQAVLVMLVEVDEIEVGETLMMEKLLLEHHWSAEMMHTHPKSRTLRQ